MKKVLRFSDYFKLNKSQAELDFVDIPLTTDIPLFVDPYAFSVEDDPWFAECNDLVVDFFEVLLQSIKSRNRHLAKSLLANLHEPNDTHLGLSRGRPRGNGIGEEQANDLYQVFTKSRAVLSGQLSDLSDCELMIPGIGQDKISDITINIIRLKLIEYTTSQCTLNNIPIYKVPSGFFWDAKKVSWNNRYVSLPLYQGQPLVLVPKAAVRFRLAVYHVEYYQHFVLNYLQSVHLNANSSLVQTLKNGKRIVTKKSLSAINPCSKEFLRTFTETHPKVLLKYKSSLKRRSRVLSSQDVEAKQSFPRVIDISQQVQSLEEINPGNDDANKFHNFIMGALETIFYPDLRLPKKEVDINEGRKRIDITFDNALSGFFGGLISKHNIKAPYIFFECKNYSNDPKNPELDQLTGRFSPERGRFGILTCREIKDKTKMISQCKDIIRDQRGYVIALDDGDIVALLKLKAENRHEQINDYMEDKFRELVM